MRLQADLGRNRYTTLLAGKDLSKIVYFFGGKDRAVGRLTNAEVQFLTGRNDVIVTPESSATITIPNKTDSVTVTFPAVPASGTDPAIPARTQPFTINALNGVAGHAKVWYSMEDGHSLDSLLDTIKRELNASFGP